jgi:hypothetical protein
MKVNIVGNFKQNTGLMQDAAILRGVLTAIHSDIQIFRVPYMFPQCGEADVNFFLEVINPSLFPFARKNIWIPNQEWTYKSWIPYIHMVDEIWVKTTEAKKIFDKYSEGKTPVIEIGWTSIDKVFNPETDKKNYSKAIVPVGKNIYRHPKPVFQAYLKIKQENPEIYSKLPTLYVVHSPEHISVVTPIEIQDKVIVKSEVLKESEYDDLLKECGLCICISLTEGFGHAVNEAMSAGCNLLLSQISPFKNDLTGGLAEFVDILEDYTYLNIDVYDFCKNLLEQNKVKINGYGNDVVAIYNVGILMEPILELNPVTLFKAFNFVGRFIVIVALFVSCETKIFS